MVLVYILAVIGLIALVLAAALGLTALALGSRRGESGDAFDLAAAAVTNIQSAAWEALVELRELTNRSQKPDQ